MIKQIGGAVSLVNNILGVIPKIFSKGVPNKLLVENNQLRTTQVWTMITVVHVSIMCAVVTYNESSLQFVECIKSLCSITGG